MSPGCLRRMSNGGSTVCGADDRLGRKMQHGLDLVLIEGPYQALIILQAPVDHNVRLGAGMGGVRWSARFFPHQSDNKGSARPKLLDHPRPKEAARARHEDVAAVPEPIRFTHSRASRQISRAWVMKSCSGRAQPWNLSLLVDLLKFLLVLVRIHGFEKAVVLEGIKYSSPLKGR